MTGIEMEAKNKDKIRTGQNSRFESRRTGGRILLIGYFIAASLSLIAMNAWGLSPLGAVLLVWLGGAVTSITIAVIASSLQASTLTEIFGSILKREYGVASRRS